MKRVVFLFLAFALLSCSPSEKEGQEAGVTVVELTVDDESELQDWRKGDVLKVHYAPTDSYYSFTCVDGGAGARFQGSVKDKDAEESPDGILYPFSETASCVDGVWTGVEIPENQSLSDFRSPALGYSERNRLIMMPLCASVSVKLSGPHHLTYASLRGAAGETVSGLFSYTTAMNIADGKIENSVSKVTVPADNTDLSGGMDLCFFINPGVFRKGFEMEICREEGGTGIIKFPESQSVSRGASIRLPERSLLPSDFGLSPAEDGERVVNGGFEYPFSLEKVSSATAGNWAYIGGWTQSSSAQPVVEVVEGIGVEGSKGLRISCPDYFVDQSVAQVITGLVPDAPYVMTAKIKTENVSKATSSGGKSTGAHIAVHIDSPIWPKTSDGVYETTDEWQEVRLEFEPVSSETTVRVRLGGSAADTRGTAIFDNVSIRYNEGMYIAASKYMRLMVEKEYVDEASVTQSQIETWLSRLDKVYEKYMELFGGQQPYEGKRITVRSATINAWAYAGNPIQWNRKYIVSTLNNNIVRGDWCFGIMHELGHDFAPGHFPQYKNSSTAWDFNEELFANFRMFYAIDQLGDEVTIINNAGYSNEKTYHGREIVQLYKTDESNSFDNTIAKGRAVEMGNGLTWCCVRIVDEFGWQVWKDTFAELYGIPASDVDTQGWTQWDKFQYLLNTLNHYVPEGRDVRETFEDGELSIIEQYLKTQT